uniref:Uncharacterized protein n=1 Tax=Oryza meridionalis TaxID=40149 RepID=A0A0E0EKI4_9ORYZ
MVVLVHHQAYWSNLPNEDAMVLQDESTDTRHAKTDLIYMHRRPLQAIRTPSRVVLVDTDDAGRARCYVARDSDDLRLLRSDDYVASLIAVLPESRIRSLCCFNDGEDYPVFDGFLRLPPDLRGACARAVIDRNHGVQNIVAN